MLRAAFFAIVGVAFLTHWLAVAVPVVAGLAGRGSRLTAAVLALRPHPA